MIYAAPNQSTWLWDDALLAGTRTRRCLAWLIDVVLVLLLVCAVWWTLALLGFLTLGLSWTLLGFVPLLPFAYHTLFLTSTLSATPGQALFGLMVRQDADLGPPTFSQAVVSTLVFYLTIATSGLLLLVALVTEHKRTLHDLLSGLVVVRADAVRRMALTGGPGSWNMQGGPPFA
ncbi:MAG TPA: RDD family protein [Acetobacteraceae bacterium]|jgi:uncharacterized RDD family membrane protein YckC|nr:RDD family protein [Acetobacteraceae bacterium]